MGQNSDPTESRLRHKWRKRSLIPSAVKSYALDLGFGLSWHLAASGEAGPQLERLASSWRLRFGRNGSGPRLTFRWGALAPGEHELTDIPYTDGWKAVDLAYARIWWHARAEDIVCELNLGPIQNEDFSMTSAAASAIYARALGHGGLPLHCALIEKNGLGVLLCGESGVGKSTCSRRIPDPWHAMCDDHALVLPNGSGGFRAHPFPTWSDLLRRNHRKSWDVQARVPLVAIFFLQQAATDEVSPIGPGEASAMLNGSANQVLGHSMEHFDEADLRMSRGRIFQNSCEVSRTVRAYTLNVSSDGRFWERIEEVVPELAGSHRPLPQSKETENNG